MRLLVVACLLLPLVLAAQLPDSTQTSNLSTTADTLSPQQRQQIDLEIEEHTGNFLRYYPADPGTALYEARAAWQLAEQHNLTQWLGQTRLHLGQAQLLNRDTLQAIGIIEGALEQFERQDNLADWLQAQTMLGDVKLALRDTTAAAAHYQSAWERAQAWNSKDVILQAGVPLKDILLAQHEYLQVLEMLPVLITAASGTPTWDQAVQLKLELARLQWLGGMQQTAIETTQDAVETAKSRGGIHSLHSSYALLARYEEEIGQPEAAIGHLRLAAEFDRTLLQADYIRRLAQRDSLLQLREQRIGSLEQQTNDMHASMQRLEEEAGTTRELRNQLDIYEKQLDTLHAYFFWLVVVLAILMAMAAVGWWRYYRLRQNVLQDTSSLKKDTSGDD